MSYIEIYYPNMGLLSFLHLTDYFDNNTYASVNIRGMY